MPKVLGFCVLVFFVLESFVFGNEQVTNSRKLTTEFEVVDVFGLHFGRVYPPENIRELSSNRNTVCSAPIVKSDGSYGVYCSVTTPPDAFPFLKQYTLELSLDHKLIGVEASSGQPYGLAEEGHTLNNFEDCLRIADRLKQWIYERYNITLSRAVEKGTSEHTQDAKILKDGTKISTWRWPKKSLSEPQSREFLMEMTCSEELFNPGGYGILRLLSFGF